jgi:hypothetical protein
MGMEKKLLVKDQILCKFHRSEENTEFQGEDSDLKDFLKRAEFRNANSQWFLMKLSTYQGFSTNMGLGHFSKMCCTGKVCMYCGSYHPLYSISRFQGH